MNKDIFITEDNLEDEDKPAQRQGYYYCARDDTWNVRIGSSPNDLGVYKTQEEAIEHVKRIVKENPHALDITKKKRREKFNEKNRQKFLALLRKGGRREKSMTDLGLAHSTLYKYLNRVPEFIEAVERAEKDAVQMIEGFLVDSCSKGNSSNIQYYLNNREKERWADKKQPTKVEIQNQMTEEQIEAELIKRGLMPKPPDKPKE